MLHRLLQWIRDKRESIWKFKVHGMFLWSREHVFILCSFFVQMLAFFNDVISQTFSHSVWSLQTLPEALQVSEMTSSLFSALTDKM